VDPKPLSTASLHSVLPKVLFLWHLRLQHILADLNKEISKKEE